jgi:hypothetical protein
MNGKWLIPLAALLIASGCASTMKTHVPVWCVPVDNTRVDGLGLTLFTASEVTNAVVNGVRIELVGPGVLIPLVPDTVSPCFNTREEYLGRLSIQGEDVNGFELSGSGTAMRGHIRGISLGLIGGIKNRVTGFAGTLGWNTALDVTGIQLGGFNTTYRTVGAQVGFNNRAAEIEGLQLGFFNG